jgi:hypothetical protein
MTLLARGRSQLRERTLILEKGLRQARRLEEMLTT